ncbi:MAG TPA: SusC/RagA family protein, partial [Mariniphaga sp.]|nr:SusC/RagA family protein [Mariniphaga sp.]
VVDLKGESIISGGRITQEGYPIDSWYVLKTDGLFQSQDEVDNYPTITSRVGPGDIKYVDLHEDGVIDGKDRYIAGNTFPDYTYGFNIGLNYKNLSLQTVWQGVQNIFVRPNFNMASPYNNGAGLTKDWLTDSWSTQNPNARLPRISARNQYSAENFSDSDFWLEDASYLRLKNIQLSYLINNPQLLNVIGIKGFTIFANGQNILTFTDVRHFDPERNITQTDINQYPAAKTYTLGVNLNF